MQVNQANLADLYKTYRTAYLEAYQGGAPVMPDLAMRMPATTMQVLIKWLGSVPGMKRWLGELEYSNLAAHAYNIVLDKFYDAVPVKVEDIENDTYGIYTPLMSALGLAARQHPDELLANTLLNGFTSLCYTGKNFFDANHEPQKGKTKFTNKLTAKLSVNSFRTARTAIKSRLNAQGRPMNLGIKLLLVVSPQNEDVAKQILQADFIQATAQAAGTGGQAGQVAIGTTAVSNVNKGSAGLLVWPQLAANADAWFLLEVGYPIKPFVWLVNKETSFNALTSPTSDHVFKNDEFLYKADGRYNTGYLLPELAEGSDGSTAAT